MILYLLMEIFFAKVDTINPTPVGNDEAEDKEQSENNEE